MAGKDMLLGVHDNGKPSGKNLAAPSLTSARVVASRVSHRGLRPIIEYKIEVETERHGPFVVWHRYSTFHHFALKLEKKKGYARSQIPKLPAMQILPNLSTFMHLHQVMALDQFLCAAVNSDTMRWGIRISKDVCVMKPRRVVEIAPPRESIESNGTTASCGTDEPSPRARVA